MQTLPRRSTRCLSKPWAWARTRPASASSSISPRSLPWHGDADADGQGRHPRNADVFVCNKADHPGEKRALSAIFATLRASGRSLKRWRPGAGVPSFWTLCWDNTIRADNRWCGFEPGVESDDLVCCRSRMEEGMSMKDTEVETSNEANVGAGAGSCRPQGTS